MFVCLLVLSYLITLSRSESPPAYKSQYPIWNVTCSFKRYEDKEPRSYSYMASHTSNLEECEEVCKGDFDCGTYRWDTEDDGLGNCARYQITEMLWEEVLRPNNAEDMWMTPTSRASSSGTKLCKGLYWLPYSNCAYNQTDGKRPSGDRFTGVSSPPSSPLTPETCQDLCNLYTSCESALFYVTRDGTDLTRCDLHNTSLADGADECGEDDYTACATYENLCRTSSTSSRTTTSSAAAIITIAIILSFRF